MTDGHPRFLLVRLGALGDVVHAMPAAAALRRAHPDARIDWLVDPRYAELVGLLTTLDRVLPIDPRGRRRDLLAGLGSLRAVDYDAAVDLQGLVKSAVLARASRARRVIGFPRAHLREPMARALYTETRDPGERPHVVHQNLALVSALGATTTRVEFPLREVPTPRAVEVLERPDERFALLNPGAAWPNKRWPPSRFGEVAAALRDRRQMRSLVLWGPGEESLAAEVAANSTGAATVLPPTGLIDILGLARAARLMVSGDTGPLHLAGAVGTPLVALFGPTRPERNGPWEAADVTVSRLDRCACHYERRCRLATPCIDDIGVDEVMAAIEARLGSHA